MSGPTKWQGGSPVSDTSNPYSMGAVNAASDGGDNAIINGAVNDMDAIKQSQMVLDAYGSSPVVNDAAAERPLNPPAVTGDTNS